MSDLPHFSTTLAHHDLELRRAELSTLQVNIGYLCNQECRHCHLDAGPTRTEIMNSTTVDEIVAFAQRYSFQVADITGGAPELNAHLPEFILRLAPLVDRLMVRCNLTALHDCSERSSLLIDSFKRCGVVVVASVPSSNRSQSESQRGPGTFERSIRMLQGLNRIGYGQPRSGLELNLVCNPTGAFLPPPEAQQEKKIRRDLLQKWGIVFNNLFVFANAPLGRFREWLVSSGNLDSYLRKLVSAFNPCTVSGLMCRSLISVAWDGYVYDCDFNLARGIPAGNSRIHVSELAAPPPPGSSIAVSDHCYACTAGAGFT
ncbi:arsenosugar biosynthesis radical SAM (seleno)protein ArsS [Desulfomonile tiedjei]|uniref:Radical SAM superfamily enzyme n=1 Tax=Desulfomonile tiedjei (strain ATCC 49306 / DSM 6799 / DCB-1) TaxID=706587 RepID=I4C7D6_DESTA|nr:arsenosugar biosynthesis radical SAM (seleno)protein ArsS [Desulfomonile tiedjei]AFM25477.1 radical SAM superfamily enzyme [Desulfomonile tiedjei DSM 6799]